MIYYSGNQSTAQEREEDQQQQNNTGLSIAELKSIMGNLKERMKLQLMEFEFARYKQANKQCKCDFCVLLMAEAAMQSGFFFSLSFRPDSVGESLAQCFCRVKWHSANWFLRASLHFFRNFSNSKISNLPAGTSHRLSAILPLYYLHRTKKLRV